jgi:hypothetical protein
MKWELTVANRNQRRWKKHKRRQIDFSPRGKGIEQALLSDVFDSGARLIDSLSFSETSLSPQKSAFPFLDLNRDPAAH